MAKLSFSQSISWQSATDWKIYDVHGSRVFDYTADTLIFFNNYSLNSDSMLTFLANVLPKSPDSIPIWMGSYTATCVLKSRLKKIDISTYGGFFYDETDRKYYQLPISISGEWLNYLSDCKAALMTTK